MTNTLKVFENKEFGKLRTVLIDNEPWFVVADVCHSLEINNSRMATSRLDDDEKGVSLIDTLGGKQNMQIVNEPGLYSLVLGSRKPEAKAFKRWVTHEVIPSIRKHGAYLTPEKIEEVLLNPDTIIKLATELKEEQEKVKVMTPKAEFYDTVTGADNDWFTMNEAVKILNLGIGRNNTYKILRWYGILNDKNIPYQRYVDAGYFRLIETTWSHNDEQYTGRALRVSSKGIDYIRKILQSEGYTYKKFEPCKGE